METRLQICVPCLWRLPLRAPFAFGGFDVSGKDQRLIQGHGIHVVAQIRKNLNVAQEKDENYVPR